MALQYSTDRKQMKRNEELLIETFTAADASSQKIAAYRGAAGTTLIVSTDSSENSVSFRQDIDDKIGFIVRWGCTANTTQVLNVSVAAGSDRRAWNKDQGAISFSITSTAAGSCKTYLIGPLETARFAIKSTSTQWSGRNEIKISVSASATAALEQRRANVTAFRLPTVAYSS